MKFPTRFALIVALLLAAPVAWYAVAEERRIAERIEFQREMHEWMAKSRAAHAKDGIAHWTGMPGVWMPRPLWPRFALGAAFAWFVVMRVRLLLEDEK